MSLLGGYPEDHLDSAYSGPDFKTYVIFVATREENGVENLVDYQRKLKVFTKLKPGNKTRVIIVTQKILLANQKKSILEKFSVFPPQFFTFSQLLVNPNDHKYTPKHTLMSKESVREVLSMISLDKLPSMKTTDPIARWFGAVPGDIFEIQRHNFTVDTLVDQSLYYRRVV